MILVIGATNIDIGGVSSKPIVKGDSNPGKVKISVGGVAHNIACNLSMLGFPVSFMSVFSNDVLGKMAEEETKALMDISHSFFSSINSSSVYLFIADEKGEMQLAINDMELIDNLSPFLIDASEEVLQSAKMIVIDTNLRQDTIEAIAKIAHEANVPLICDPVSTIKLPKIKNILPYLTLLKPNLLELEKAYEMLTNKSIKIKNSSDLLVASEALLDTGLKKLVVSLGSNGAFYCSKTERFYTRGTLVDVVNTNGAGDAFVAGFCEALYNGLDNKQCLMHAVAAAKLVVESEETVSPFMNLKNVELISKELKVNELFN